MITDRTAADVTAALALIENKVKIFDVLSDAEIIQLNRGCCTLDTLTRIESTQYDLAETLIETGYTTEIIVETKTWTNEDIFTASDLERLCENDEILRQAFYTLSTTPDTPTARYYFSVFNAIEQIIADIDTLLTNMQAAYKYCGTRTSGGGVL